MARPSAWSTALAAVVAVGCNDGSPTGPGSPAAPARTEFTIAFAHDPMLISLVHGAPMGVPDYHSLHFYMLVKAPDDRGGELQRVDLTLIDRASGATLGSWSSTGPFHNGDGRHGNPNPLAQPGGAIAVDFYAISEEAILRDYRGQPGRFEARAEVLDARGQQHRIQATVAAETVPPAVLVSPVRATVRQNDPATGCPFDPEHGYGFSIEFDWERLDPRFDIGEYRVMLYDGRGVPITATSALVATGPPIRYVRCDYHVIGDRDGGATWVLGASGFKMGEGAWTSESSASFDFQSCREAGTPGCQ